MAPNRCRAKDPHTRGAARRAPGAEGLRARGGTE